MVKVGNGDGDIMPGREGVLANYWELEGPITLPLVFLIPLVLKSFSGNIQNIGFGSISGTVQD